MGRQAQRAALLEDAGGAAEYAYPKRRKSLRRHMTVIRLHATTDDVYGSVVSHWLGVQSLARRSIDEASS